MSGKANTDTPIHPPLDLPPNWFKKNAFVLSGGASHGDFEVGVVRYLYERNIRPSLLVGNSVGAINAAKLAEGENAQDPKRGLPGLIAIWKEMMVDSDMWRETDWWKNLQKDITADAVDVVISTSIATAFLGPFGMLVGAKRLSDVKDDMLQELSGGRSMATLDPIAKRMRAPGSLDLNKVHASGIALRLSAVALESGKLRFVTERGEMYERDGKTQVDGPVVFDNPALSNPILAEIAQANADLADARAELHGDDNDFETGKHGGAAARINGFLQKLRSLKIKLMQTPHHYAALSVDLLDAVIASSSLPLVFPPVQLGDSWYIDGGVRSIAPIEAAVNWGADVIYAIVASQEKMDEGRSFPGQETLHSYTSANVLDIAMRAANDIMPDENLHRDLNPPRGWGVPTIVIRPDFDIHNGMTIDPGLIDIRMDHGYMRADDTVQAYAQKPADYEQLVSDYSYDRSTSAIVNTRLEIWKHEYRANRWTLNWDATGTLHAPTPDVLASPASVSAALDRVRQLKRELKQLVDARIAAGGAVPPNVSDWWLKWERHPFPCGTLWDAAHPFAPLKHLTITVSPANVKFGTIVKFVVSAQDAGSPVIADVAIDGKVVGQTGSAITYQFNGKITTEFDPELKIKITEVVAPTVLVKARGYFSADVPFKFSK